MYEPLVAKRLLEDPKVPLAKRIDPNHADANGQTPLHHIAVDEGAAPLP